jgi:hypothetical protein
VYSSLISVLYFIAIFSALGGTKDVYMVMGVSVDNHTDTSVPDIKHDCNNKQLYGAIAVD